MALGLNFGTGAAGDGDSLLVAFTSINSFLSTTTKEASGDLSINGIAVGRGSGGNIRNTAIGSLTLINNTTGFSNTAIGVGALQGNTTASSNTAIGSDALYFNTTGIANTALGINALQKNISGNDNSALGSGALFNNTTGNLNTAIGTSALINNTTGTHNTALGYATLFNHNSGVNNTAIGREALNGNTSFNNCSGLGYDAQVSASNQVRLGNTAVTTVTSSGTASFSDIRDKADIRDTVLGLDFISKLRAVDYKWDYREDYKSEMPLPLKEEATEEEIEEYKILMDEWLESCKFSNLVHDGSKKRKRYHHGLIAQEVKEVIEESRVDFGGFQDHTINGGDEVMTVTYTELIAPMIKAIQELKAEIELLKAK